MTVRSTLGSIIEQMRIARETHGCALRHGYRPPVSQDMSDMDAAAKRRIAHAWLHGDPFADDGITYTEVDALGRTVFREQDGIATVEHPNPIITELPRK